MNMTLKESLKKSYPQYSSDLNDIFSQAEELATEEKSALLRTLARYLEEGEKSSYRANTKALIRFLQDEQLLPIKGSVIDFGAGAGDLVTELALAFPKIKVTGLDLSPSFVRTFKNQKSNISNALMQVGVIDLPLSNKFDLNAAVISVLTLDRLRDPKQLIDNMGYFSGSKIIAALLPNNPIDDNPSRQDTPIIYTPKDKQITSGEGAQQDILEISKILESSWEQPIIVTKVPYTVQSSGDAQVYQLTVFYARGNQTIPDVLPSNQIKK